MANPPNFVPGIGRLAVSRNEFKSHLNPPDGDDGYHFKHFAKQIRLDHEVIINLTNGNDSYRGSADDVQEYVDLITGATNYLSDVLQNVGGGVTFTNDLSGNTSSQNVISLTGYGGIVASKGSIFFDGITDNSTIGVISGSTSKDIKIIGQERDGRGIKGGSVILSGGVGGGSNGSVILQTDPSTNSTGMLEVGNANGQNYVSLFTGAGLAPGTDISIVDGTNFLFLKQTSFASSEAEPLTGSILYSDNNGHLRYRNSIEDNSIDYPLVNRALYSDYSKVYQYDLGAAIPATINHGSVFGKLYGKTLKNYGSVSLSNTFAAKSNWTLKGTFVARKVGSSDGGPDGYVCEFYVDGYSDSDGTVGIKNGPVFNHQSSYGALIWVGPTITANSISGDKYIAITSGYISGGTTGTIAWGCNCTLHVVQETA